MATPDMEHRSTEVEWSIRPDYERVDNEGKHVCAMTGFSKRDGEIVYRGPFVDEFYGFFAIGQDSAEQLARLAGFVDPETIDSTVQQAAESLEQIVELNRVIQEQEQIITAYATLLGPPDQFDEDSE